MSLFHGETDRSEEISCRLAKALEDMAADSEGSVPYCQDVQRDGATVYVVIDDVAYAIETSDAM